MKAEVQRRGYWNEAEIYIQAAAVARVVRHELWAGPLGSTPPRFLNDAPTPTHLADGQITCRGTNAVGDWSALTEFVAKALVVSHGSDPQLRSRAGREVQSLRCTAPIETPGLWYVPVKHEGNRNCSPEEIEVVSALASSFVNGGEWRDHQGVWRPIAWNDVLIVAPYNAQVYAIKERLSHANVGTVDKFQGQEAPIVIYSMATSSPDEAPRGMEFLYSANRLNVATSRAQCACVLVASPKLLEPECHTPRQMRMANAFCRYLEMAKRLEAAAPTV